jgi:DNA-directed RNA polymerase specialized sigma subunit
MIELEREDLYTLRKAMKNVDHLKEQIATLELRRISPRSAAYGLERVQSSAKGDIQPDQIAKIDRLIEKYRNELNDILNLQAEFEKLLLNLDPFEKRIMRHYYIDGMIWEEIWQETNYCTRQLLRLHKKIMDKLFPEN